ncbi:zinc-dependent alcohol dehydrogenase [Plantibacter sp. YIM 135249]|uniref:zinc-dependent alcohol dehydrogenase n=1 Tax=Plantibacter sp. YIM 135249 TaxID=3423918 RepID=UPI003D3464B4
MRALVITSARHAEVQEVPWPVPSAGQLLVDVERVGICGTDVELFSGEMAYIQQGRTSFPLRPGHEWTGRVTAVGRAEDEIWIGRRVIGDTMLGCGRCEYCESGRHHVCPRRCEVGVLDGWAGALAEQVLIPTRFAHRIPDSMTLSAAALVEPGGNSWRSVRAAAVSPGSTLLVIGSGTIGLLAAQFALAAGADVHVAGARPESLDLARALGVRHTWMIDELVSGREERFDAVIEATSDRSMPALAVQLTKPTGRVVYVGLAAAPSPIDTRTIALQDITAVGVLSASPGLAATIDSFASGAVVPDPIVSEVIGLEDVPSRLAGLRGVLAGPGPKVHVNPRI